MSQRDDDDSFPMFLGLCILLLIIWTMALTGCAAVTPGEGFQSCDMMSRGDYDDRLKTTGLSREVLNKAVSQALDAATFTTDIRLSDTTENCRMLRGFNVYSKSTVNYMLGDHLVGGHTTCLFHLIVVGQPWNGDWGQSVLVHEIFHAMQGCSGTPPQDDPKDQPGHENWVRDGIYRAIDYEMRQP